MSVPRSRVAVVFGGPSVEHDVSIITAQQAMAVLADRHEVTPIYLAKDGTWWTGESLRDVSSFGPVQPTGARPVELRIGAPAPFVEPSQSRMKRDRPLEVDVVLNAIHGTGGEDGALLGALELAGVAHVGRGVAASAVAMDKHLAKLAVAAAGIDVLPHRRFERSEWTADPERVLDAVRELGEHVVVKPVTLGSSIGVKACSTRDEIREAIELALELDRQVLVEESVAGRSRELNVAVMGRPGGEYVVSEVEQPLGGEAGLSFDDKYLRGSKGGGAKDGGGKTGGGAKGAGGGMVAQDRVVPAQISPELRDALRAQAEQAHRALRFAGVVRFDFFAFDDDRIVLNEPNTVPGSFAFYLFEHVGVAFPALLDGLLSIALEEHREERGTTRTFDSALLELHSAR